MTHDELLEQLTDLQPPSAIMFKMGGDWEVAIKTNDTAPLRDHPGFDAWSVTSDAVLLNNSEMAEYLTKPLNDISEIWVAEEWSCLT